MIRSNNVARAARLAVATTSTAFAFAFVQLPGDARAAGMYVADHGVVPRGRAGAYVAGANDFGAAWYNPAGLADAGTSLFLDLTWVNYSTEYARRTQVADAGGTLRTYDYPTVEGKTPFLPIPTIGGTYNFGREKQYTAGFGLMAPCAAITSYPLRVGNTPSPSRYALVSLDGSALVIPGAWIAARLNEKFRVGGGLELLTGAFQSTVVFSASPTDRLISAPEDERYDAFSSLKVGPIFAPSLNLGVMYDPHPRVRLGLSGQLPFWVSAPASVKVRLPTAPPFDNAYQSGTDAHVKFTLPAIVRLGIEVRPTDAVKVELAYVREFWSMHESIDIRPENITLNGVTGFPSPFAVSPITLPRNFQDSNSIRLGAEGRVETKSFPVDIRGGVSYETSAVPAAYVTPLTVDAGKVMVAIGGSVHLAKKWRIDASIGKVFIADVEVAPGDAKVPRVNPVKGNPTETEAINGGKYSSGATLLGLGVQYTF